MPKYFKGGYQIKILSVSSSGYSSPCSSSEIDTISKTERGEGGSNAGGGSPQVLEDICFECKKPFAEKGLRCRATFICDHVKCFTCIQTKTISNHCSKCKISNDDHQKSLDVEVPVAIASAITSPFSLENPASESESSAEELPFSGGSITTTPTCVTMLSRSVGSERSPSFKNRRFLKFPELSCPLCDALFYYEDELTSQNER